MFKKLLSIKILPDLYKFKFIPIIIITKYQYFLAFPIT